MKHPDPTNDVSHPHSSVALADPHGLYHPRHNAARLHREFSAAFSAWCRRRHLPEQDWSMSMQVNADVVEAKAKANVAPTKLP